MFYSIMGRRYAHHRIYRMSARMWLVCRQHILLPLSSLYSKVHRMKVRARSYEFKLNEYSSILSSLLLLLMFNRSVCTCTLYHLMYAYTSTHTFVQFMIVNTESVLQLKKPLSKMNDDTNCIEISLMLFLCSERISVDYPNMNFLTQFNVSIVNTSMWWQWTCYHAWIYQEIWMTHFADLFAKCTSTRVQQKIWAKSNLIFFFWFFPNVPECCQKFLFSIENVSIFSISDC